MSESNAVSDVWQSIEEWLDEHAPEARSALKPGASEEALAKFETDTGLKLPPDYKLSLQRHNGGLHWSGYRYLSAEAALKQWRTLAETQQSGAFEGVEPAYAGDARISSDWWNKAWIPFAADSGGNLICIDTAPGKNGTAGQVIIWETVEGPAPTEHRSFAEWLAHFRDDLTAGKYREDEDGFLTQAG